MIPPRKPDTNTNTFPNLPEWFKHTSTYALLTQDTTATAVPECPEIAQQDIGAGYEASKASKASDNQLSNAVYSSRSTLNPRSIAREPRYLAVDSVEDIKNGQNISVNHSIIYRTGKRSRAALCQAPWLSVFSGTQFICHIPWELFKVLSTTSDAIDSIQLELRLPANLSNVPFLYIQNWLKTIRDDSHVSRIQYRNDLLQDLAICRAARFLGMQPHVQHIHNFYWAYFKRKYIPDYEDIDAIIRLAIPGHQDPFMDCVAKRLAHLEYNKEIPDPAEFEQYLVQHPALNAMVQETVGALTILASKSKGSAHANAESRWVNGDGWAS